MVEINLLAWRGQKNKYECDRLRRFIFAAIVIAVIVLLVAHYSVANLLEQQRRRVNLLGANLPEMVPEVDVGGRVEKFQSTASLLEMLNVASNTALSGVCYQKISRQNKQVQLIGRAWSMMSVTWVLHALEVSNIYGNILLRDIKHQPENNLLQFSFDGTDG